MTINGDLNVEDLSATNGSPAVMRYQDDYLLRGVAPGQQVRLRLESSDFDAYLEVVLLDNPDDVRESNDNGSSVGNNAQLTHTVGSGRAANVLVRVRSNGNLGIEGAYRLVVDQPPLIYDFSPASGSVGRQRGGQAGHSGADDHDVGLLLPGRADAHSPSPG